MKTLAKRLQWVIDAGLVKSARQWGLAAQLSHAAVSAAIQRESAMATETVEELARLAGVSAAWLAFGHGSPDDMPAAETEAPGTLKEALLELARDRVFVSRSATDRAIAERGAPYDSWTVPEWTAHLLRLTQQDLRNDPAVFREMIRDRGPQFRASQLNPAVPKAKAKKHAADAPTKRAGKRGRRAS